MKFVVIESIVGDVIRLNLYQVACIIEDDSQDIVFLAGSEEPLLIKKYQLADLINVSQQRR